MRCFVINSGKSRRNSMELQGKYGTAIVYAGIVEQEAISQIIQILNQPMMKGVKVRIMPDVHAGAGIVIGYTAMVNDYIVPNFIGVDIGCGLTALPLGKTDISFSDLDKYIRENIPHGFSVNQDYDRGEAYCAFQHLSEMSYDDFEARIQEIARRVGAENRLFTAIGSLGGGNHFLSVNRDSEGRQYFVVHSGSRNFGKCVAEYHQKLAKDTLSPEEMKKAISEIKAKMPPEDIEKAIREFRAGLPKKVKNLEYLEGGRARAYFEDMKVAQLYAQLNRRVILCRIANFFQMAYSEYFLTESVHNYIDFEDNIIRKGAISAHKGEKLLIPLSMADGILFCEGKGNFEWNYSAPHGAGRLMSRGKAKATISVEDYKKRMEEAGVWTSCVGQGTLDEAPQAYKDPEMIKNAIGDTVTILDHWKEVYNFKAN
jgi:RNA-splicing ligase RtcB